MVSPIQRGQYTLTHENSRATHHPDQIPSSAGSGVLETPLRIGPFLPSPKNLLFGLEPIVQLRTRLITPLDVGFVRSSLDSFLEWKGLARGFRRTCGRWHSRE